MKSVWTFTALVVALCYFGVRCEETENVTVREATEEVESLLPETSAMEDELPTTSPVSSDTPSWREWLTSFFWNEEERHEEPKEAAEEEAHNDAPEEEDEEAQALELIRQNAISIRPPNVKLILIITLIVIFALVSLSAYLRVYFDNLAAKMEAEEPSK